MADREQLLCDEILPIALAQPIDEIIVAGRYTAALEAEFPNVKFLHVEPVVRWRTEAGHIRQVATEATNVGPGDILIYTPDDHALSLNFAANLRKLQLEEWDVWCPERRHALTPKRLNNGHLTFASIDGRPNPTEAYMSWHCNVLRRWVAEEVSWFHLPPDQDFQDIPTTRAWRSTEAILRWGPPLIVYDVEATESEE